LRGGRGLVLKKDKGGLTVEWGFVEEGDRSRGREK